MLSATSSDGAAAPGATGPMVSVRALGKAYRMYGRPLDRFKQALNWGRREYYQEFWALREVSFDVYPGEMMGIIGRNGSGKSTLLQIIAGTLAPTTGTVQVRDRVAALLELGAGFDPDFTGRENVYFSGVVSGLPMREIEESFAAIAAFADIGEFINHPVRTYSSGMVVRLAFAVQLFAARGVLIVDEALAVGDEGFQRKCIAAMERFQKDGGTILLVTHDTQTVVKMCHRALLLDHGRILAHGPSKPVVDAYHKLLYGSAEQGEQLREALQRVDGCADRVHVAPAEPDAAPASPRPATPSRTAYYDPDVACPAETSYGAGGAEIVNVGTFDEDGRPANVLVSGRPCEVRYRVRFDTDAEGVRCGIMIKTKEGVDVVGVSSLHMGRQLERVRAGQSVGARFRMTLNLAPGTYFLNTGVSCLRGGEDTYLHRRVDVAAIRVVSPDHRGVYGLAFVAPEIHCEILKGHAASHV